MWVLVGGFVGESLVFDVLRALWSGPRRVDVEGGLWAGRRRVVLVGCLWAGPRRVAHDGPGVKCRVARVTCGGVVGDR